MSLAYNCFLVAYLLILLCCGLTKDPDSYTFVALCFLVVAALIAISSLHRSHISAGEAWASKSMSDTASTVAPDSGDLQSAGHEHQSLLPWPERCSSIPDVIERDLEHKTRPDELDLLPDGGDTPYELVQIFKAAWSKKALRFWNSDDRQLQEVVPEADAPRPEAECASLVSSKNGNIGSGNDAICTPSTASLNSHENTYGENTEQTSTISSSTRPRLRLLASTADFFGSKIKPNRSNIVRASLTKAASPLTA